jgi:spore maturation protein CgeB
MKQSTGVGMFEQFLDKREIIQETPSFGVTEVLHAIPEGDPRRWGKIDLFVWPDHGEDGLPVDKYKCPGPSAYWASDSHLGMDYRLEKAKEFDYVFVAIPGHIPKFKEAVGHDRVYHLPHAGEPACYQYKPVVKKYDVCFIGHLPTDERVDLLDTLFAAIPNFFYGQRFFETANDIYNQSKLVFNHCISKESNMRVFEGTLSGTPVLCNYAKDVEDLGYKDGENIIFYRDPQEMVEKAKYYLEHEDLLEKVGKAGMEHTLNNHTYYHRAKKIIETVKEDRDGR